MIGPTCVCTPHSVCAPILIPTVTLALTQVLFLALTYRVRTVGIELLAPLVSISEAVRDAHLSEESPRAHARSADSAITHLAQFEAADALEYAVPPSAVLVYVDDTAWDTPTVRRLSRKLAKLASGTLVVHNTAADGYEEARSFRHVASVAVGTSWNPAHEVHVHEVV